MKINSFLWIVPFLFFIAGYTTLSLIRGNQHIAAPALVGQTVANATLTLAQQHLNFRVLAQKEDNDLQDGTILSQVPSSGQLMRLNQSVFCVISKKTSSIPAPNCIGNSLSVAQNCCTQFALKAHIHYVASSLPVNTCIAQSPLPGEPIVDRSIILYVATQNSSLFIVPSFIGVSLDEAISALELYEIKPLIVHSKNHHGPNAKKCMIIEQKPLAGSIIDMSNQRTIQFLIE